MTWHTLRIATYNVHRCRGMDGRTRPQRTIDVLAGIDADLVALQEVLGPGPRGGSHAEEIGAAPYLAVPERNAAERQIGRFEDGASLEEIYAEQVRAAETIGG